MNHLLLTLSGREAAAAVEAAFDATVGTPKRRWWPKMVTVWLSGALARPFLFGPVSGLKGFKEAHDAAAAMAPAASGLSGRCAAWLASDPSQEAALAVAVEQSLLDALSAAAAARGFMLAHVRPAWAVIDSDVGSADHLWCSTDSDSSTVLVKAKGGWRLAATYAPGLEAAALAGLLQRQQASMGFTDEQVLNCTVTQHEAGALPRTQVQGVIGAPA